MDSSVLLETVTVYEPEIAASYSIDFVAHYTGVPRHRIAVYCRTGVISTVGDPANDGWRFSREGIAELRRAEDVRRLVGDNPAAIRLVLRLRQEIEHLQRELGAARGEPGE